ncbi:MarR family winged helix-turn-helix transcriptional regulator [Salinicoccus sp. HZC-1]|uniref:MarR family winged helix-turn-helix transcriptional regulator n=1 Tax=Salinicoccus sp. HZC-1 TaxID=3385497 RepID=UPI00398A6871
MHGISTRNICRYIYLLNAKIEHLAEFEAEQGNLTRDELYIIEMIDEDPGITQKTLVERFKKKQTSISRAITKLVDRGFIQKNPNATDMRASHLTLTDQGKETLEQLEAPICSLSDHIVEELDEKEKEHLMKALEKIHL